MPDLFCEFGSITGELICFAGVISQRVSARDLGNAALDALRSTVGSRRRFLLGRVGLLAGAGWLIGLGIVGSCSRVLLCAITHTDDNTRTAVIRDHFLIASSYTVGPRIRALRNCWKWRVKPLDKVRPPAFASPRTTNVPEPPCGFTGRKNSTQCPRPSAHDACDAASRRCRQRVVSQPRFLLRPVTFSCNPLTCEAATSRSRAKRRDIRG